MHHTDLEEDALYLEDEDTQKDKYLTFHLAGEDYAIAVKHVVEIVGLQRITEVPDTMTFVKGVINLRGKIIPVIDVRIRFRLETRTYDERTCIIIVDMGETTVGLIVDKVSEVMDIPESQVSPPPKTTKGSQNRYIQGFGRIEDRVKLILDIEMLLSDTEKESLQEIAPEANVAA